jgi:hypothetical protein
MGSISNSGLLMMFLVVKVYIYVFRVECFMGVIRANGFSDVRMSLKSGCYCRNSLNSRVIVDAHSAEVRVWFVGTRG